MNTFFGRTIVASLSLAALVAGMMLPAAAGPYQGASNRNLWHVRHHIEFDIQQLQHDARDYRGHRVAAIRELQHARNELLAAEEYRHGRMLGGFSGAAGSEPFDRNQWRSDRNLWSVRRDVAHEYQQLSRDADDYGGHKGAAMEALQQARAELVAGERFAHSRGL